MADLTSDDQTEIIRAFAQESRGLVEQIVPYICKLGKNNDMQTMKYCYLFFHSIKGGASFVGHNNIAHVASEAEILLNQLLSGMVPLQVPKHADLLSHACDFLKKAFDHLEKQLNDDDLESQAETVVSEFRDAADEPIKVLKKSRSLKKDQQARKTFIVGGGKDCFAIFTLLSNDESISIVGVFDLKETAPGVLLAEEAGISVTKDFQDFLKKNDVDFIIDVTEDIEVYEKLNSLKKPGVELLSGHSIKLILKLVVERENRKKETEQNLTEQEALNHIGLMLISAKSTDVVFQRIVQSSIKLTKSKAGSLAIYNEKTNEFKMEVAIGFSKTFSKIQRWELRKNGLTDFILSNKQPTVIPDITKNTHCNNSILLQEGIKSLIAVPLTLSGKTVGILYVDDFIPKNINPRITSLMASLATQATFAIEKNRLLQKAEQLAVIDELTQLYNHRYFVHALSNEINRSKRLKHPISFLMLDIDHFKYYNDHQGHQNGNIVLKTAANLMLENIREIDILARYGGEEFTVILPGAECDEGMVIAQRIRKAIENCAFPFGEKQPGGKLTVSIGLANYPKDAADGSDLVEKADCALYRAKREGRNRVIIF